MRKVVRITESDLVRIVKRVIKENNAPERNVIDFETGKMVGTHQYGVGFVANKIGERMGYESHPTSIPDGTKMERNELAPTEMRNRRDKDDFAQLRNRRNDLNEEDENDCESLVEGMRYVFNEFMGYVKNSDGEESPEELYDDLESELSGFLSQGEEMDCDNIEHLEEKYEKYLERFRKLFGLR